MTGVRVLAFTFIFLLLASALLFTLGILMPVLGVLNERVLALFPELGQGPLGFVVQAWERVRDAVVPFLPALAALGVAVVAVVVVAVLVGPAPHPSAPPQ